jgi:hypothetical protein
MSLRDLVTFAQNEISRGELLDSREPLPPRREPIFAGTAQPGRVPAEGDLDTISVERAPVPDWLLNPDSEPIQIGGPSSIIFSESEFEQPIVPGLVAAQQPDALAYYRPFHFYPNAVWGVYLRTRGVLELAAQLKGSPITHGEDPAIQAAQITLVQHELFHCAAEAAVTRAEVIARSSVYRPYFYDPNATANEEAMANANTHRKVAKAYPAYIAALESWMRKQGPGYRDFDRFIGRRFSKGRLVCSQHIVRFVPPPLMPLPSRLPSDFLIERAMPKSVPMYVVVDAAIAGYVLRPFPKGNRIRVWVHTRGEHPPPHIHVEIPLGSSERRRCIWPSLERGSPDWCWPLPTYKGDRALKAQEYAKLREYLSKHGGSILAKLKSVYPDWQLAAPVV